MVDKILYFPRDVEVRITPKSVVTDEFRQKIRLTPTERGNGGFGSTGRADV